MSAHLDLDDVVSGHPQARKELDTLRAQLEAADAEARGLRMELRGYRLHVASFGKHVASVGCEYRQPYEGEEGDYLVNVRAEAAEADAQRWREFCRQIDSGDFPHPVWHDAMHMGSGALEMHIDSERVARTKEQQA